MRQIAKELGVRYVLEGSAAAGRQPAAHHRTIGHTLSGAHIWADKFDGAFEDVFDVQDRIPESVVAVVEAENPASRNRPLAP